MFANRSGLNPKFFNSYLPIVNRQSSIVIIFSFLFIIITHNAYAGTVKLPKTGQTACYDTSGKVIPCSGTGQDGEKQTGVAWPSPRFTNNGNGAVTDNLTGLIWLKDAGCMGGKIWSTAVSDVEKEI